MGILNEKMKQIVDEILSYQTIEGAFTYNVDEHTGYLRSLNILIPNSYETNLGIDWFLKKWSSFDEIFKNNESTSVGALVLMEINFELYGEQIKRLVDYLISVQEEDGSWGTKLYGSNYGYISHSIIAISKFYGYNNITAIKGLEFILKKQEENGSWDNNIYYTSMCLLALLYMGHGPKISKIYLENQMEIMEQKNNLKKTLFIHTSPIYYGKIHVKEIYLRIQDMLKKGEKDIRICSLYFDVLYEEIINLIYEKPNLNVKIITRPKKDIKGSRNRIASNVIDLLIQATKGNLVQSEILHARMLIIDKSELLISSADFTRDQLYDEFNAGLWTNDPDAIALAIDYFDNIFSMEKEQEEI